MPVFSSTSVCGVWVFLFAVCMFVRVGSILDCLVFFLCACMCWRVGLGQFFYYFSCVVESEDVGVGVSVWLVGAGGVALCARVCVCVC